MIAENLRDSQTPVFRPHPLLRSGHLQTLAGLFFPGTLFDYSARRHHVAMADGDQVVLHDDCPEGWSAGNPAALMMHGLGGCHQSVYMRRIAHRLCERGVRVFRMDLRGCGAGIELARLPYHSGRSDDAATALRYLGSLCPGSPVTLIGFSLGGNIALKLAGESGHNPPANLERVMAVSPPCDLSACSAWISRLRNRGYDRYFADLLRKQIIARQTKAPHVVSVEFARRPKQLREIDDWFTAPVCGFGTADNYYRTCSSAPLLADIRIPTLIVTAADDPLVQPDAVQIARRSSSVSLLVPRHGGHLGFIGSARTTDPDRRWIDWRIVEWVFADSDNDRGNPPDRLRAGGSSHARKRAHADQVSPR